MALTDVAETYTANWLAGQPTTAPQLPYSVALMTSNGDDSVQGTEVSGGSYARQEVTFNSATGNTISNSDTIRFNNMPASTIVGAEIYDNSATPVRWFYGSLATTRDLVAGDPVEFAPGTLTITTD